MPEEAVSLIKEQASDRLGETLEELVVPPEPQEEVKQAKPPLSGTVQYNDRNVIDLQKIATPESMVAATKNIQDFTSLEIERFAGVP